MAKALSLSGLVLDFLHFLWSQVFYCRPSLHPYGTKPLEFLPLRAGLVPTSVQKVENPHEYQLGLWLLMEVDLCGVVGHFCFTFFRGGGYFVCVTFWFAPPSGVPRIRGVDSGIWVFILV